MKFKKSEILMWERLPSHKVSAKSVDGALKVVRNPQNEMIKFNSKNKNYKAPHCGIYEVYISNTLLDYFNICVKMEIFLGVFLIILIILNNEYEFISLFPALSRIIKIA